jgi:large subunit ribosomal protein L10
MSKQERQDAAATIEAKVKTSAVVYVTDFSGLNVLRMTEFRRRLRAVGARYIVVKNTLARRGLAANQMAALEPHMKGPTGLVLAGSDPLPAAKVLLDFGKEFEKPTVKAGFVDGAAVLPEHVKRLGMIPPREVLLAQMAGAMNGLLSNFTLVLDALREQRSPQINVTENT